MSGMAVGATLNLDCFESNCELDPRNGPKLIGLALRQILSPATSTALRCLDILQSWFASKSQTNKPGVPPIAICAWDWAGNLPYRGYGCRRKRGGPERGLDVRPKLSRCSQASSLGADNVVSCPPLCCSSRR